MIFMRHTPLVQRSFVQCMFIKLCAVLLLGLSLYAFCSPSANAYPENQADQSSASTPLPVNRPTLPSPPSPNAPYPANCPALLQHTVERLQDERPISLCQYYGRVILIVNTASYCGFTPQYKGLEALYSRYQSKGLVVLGFPSNDFSQEPNKNAEIADFCENTFGVKFPMFTKTSVKGSNASALYKQLAQKTNVTPGWNFYKYLISRDGKIVRSYTSFTTPDEPSFIAEIEKQLATQAP